MVVIGRARVLQHHRQALPDPDADRGHAPALAGLGQPPGQGAEDPAARRAERVAHGDRPALGVDDLGIDLPGVDAGQGLDRERLVELDRGDVRPADAGPGQGPVGRLDRCETEVLRGRGPRLPGRRSAPGVPGRPARPPCSEPTSTAEAPSLSGDAFPAVMVPPGRKTGLRADSAADDASARMPSSRFRSTPGTAVTKLVVEPRAPGGVGPLVRAQRELVLTLAGDAEPLLQLLVGLAEGNRPLGRHLLVDQPPAERGRHRRGVAGGKGPGRLRQHPGRPGHGLAAAREHHVGVAGLHRPGRDDHRVERGPAQPVHGGRRYRDGQAREQDGHPADVAVVLPRPVRITPDDVADLRRIQVGHGREQAGDHGGRQVVRADLGERAAEPAERRARRGVHEGGGAHRLTGPLADLGDGHRIADRCARKACCRISRWPPRPGPRSGPRWATPRSGSEGSPPSSTPLIT